MGYKRRTVDVITGIERLAGMGHTLTEVSTFVGVGRRQLERWRRASPAVEDAVQRGKARAHVTVTKALFDLATGKAVKNEMREPVLDEEGKQMMGLNGKPMERVSRTYYPPDLGAQVFILCNRYPDRWRNTQRVEIEHGGGAVKNLVLVLAGGNGAGEPERAVELTALDPAALPAPGGNGSGEQGEVAAGADVDS